MNDPSEGAIYYRELPDGHAIEVRQMTFANYRLSLLEFPGYLANYCYRDMDRAIAAAIAWDPDEGDPLDGWHRHIETGRRRENGDPNAEHRYW